MGRAKKTTSVAAKKTTSVAVAVAAKKTTSVATESNPPVEETKEVIVPVVEDTTPVEADPLDTEVVNPPIEEEADISPDSELDAELDAYSAVPDTVETDLVASVVTPEGLTFDQAIIENNGNAYHIRYRCKKGTLLQLVGGHKVMLHSKYSPRTILRAKQKYGNKLKFIWNSLQGL